MSDVSNGIDAELAEKYLKLDDESTARLLELQMEYMSECRDVREEIKRHFKSAVAEGMPEDGWRVYLKEHRIKAKAAKQIENLYADEDDGEVKETAGMIREALGADYATLPLGDFAVSRAPADDEDTPPKPAKKRKASKGEKVDTSAASKADALNVGDDDDNVVDLRGNRQREKEALRKAEAAERLKGMKKLDDETSPVIN